MVLHRRGSPTKWNRRPVYYEGQRTPPNRIVGETDEQAMGNFDGKVHKRDAKMVIDMMTYVKMIGS